MRSRMVRAVRLGVPREPACLETQAVASGLLGWNRTHHSRLHCPPEHDAGPETFESSCGAHESPAPSSASGARILPAARCLRGRADKHRPRIRGAECARRQGEYARAPFHRCASACRGFEMRNQLRRRTDTRRDGQKGEQTIMVFVTVEKGATAFAGAHPRKHCSRTEHQARIAYRCRRKVWHRRCVATPDLVGVLSHRSEPL